MLRNTTTRLVFRPSSPTPPSCGLCLLTTTTNKAYSNNYNNAIYFGRKFYSTAGGDNIAKQVETEIKQKKHNTINPLQCWSCSRFVKKQDLFCGACNIVQPLDAKPASKNLFELFDFGCRLIGFNRQPHFDMHMQKLSDTYKQLQRKLHPDLYTQKSPQEQSFSAEQSAGLNHAYNVLKTPHLRAEYLLGLNGVDISEKMGTIFDQELLMEIMETREMIDDLDKDSEEIKSIAKENRGKMEILIKELGEIFSKKDYEQAKEKAIKLRYLAKIQEEIIGKVGYHI